MRTSLLVLFSFISFTLFAQDWLPIDTSNIYHYAYSTDGYIDKSVKTTLSNDTTYFETIIDSCAICTNNQPNTVAHRYRPDFLGYYMINDFDSVYTFIGRDNFIIKTKKQIGDSWQFSTGKTAELVNKEYALVGATWDSIQKIVINSTDTITLAKHHGVLQFPLDRKNRLYKLVGIENLFGRQHIDFWDIYDFDVGDIFQYSETYSTGDAQEYGNWYNKKIKVKVLDKSIQSDGFHYYVENKYLRTEGGYYANSGQFTDSLIFSFVNRTPSKSIIGSFTGLKAWEQFQSGEDTVYLQTQMNFNSQNDLVKYVAVPNSPPNPYHFEVHNILECIDTLCTGAGWNRRYEEYQEGLGRTTLSGENFETSFSVDLIGYYKGIDTVGTIYPDAFYVGITDNLPLQNFISFSPNPCQGQLKIELFGDEKLDLKIVNILGEIVLEKDLSSSQIIDINFLPTGLYVLTVCSENGRCGSDKLLVK